MRVTRHSAVRWSVLGLSPFSLSLSLSFSLPNSDELLQLFLHFSHHPGWLSHATRHASPRAYMLKHKSSFPDKRSHFQWSLLSRLCIWIITTWRTELGLRINNDVLAIHLRVRLLPAGEINFSPLPMRVHTSSVRARIKEARILITGSIKPNKKYKCHGRERLSSKLEKTWQLLAS